MNIVVIDGQGGGMGKMLVAGIKEEFPGAMITAVGTNANAAMQMKKAGADRAASGENAVVVACRKADIILGPVGIVVADALLGEVTPKMAQAVGACGAKKVLLPVNMCDTIVVGVEDLSLSTLIRAAIEEIKRG
ncbi:MAG: DUF3842 family protein [Clostridia bacterium]|nr:DUF3842 family protein [Clostridia bacterium]